MRGGLAALEALACGTPAVVSRSSALAEIVQPSCGRAVPDDPHAFAAAVEQLASGDPSHHRRAARLRAEQFDWPTSVEQMLAMMRRSC